MTEGRDLAAIEAAELRALRAEADRRREELGQTIEALRKKIAENVGVRRLAEVAAEWAAARIRQALANAIRSAARLRAPPRLRAHALRAVSARPVTGGGGPHRQGRAAGQVDRGTQAAVIGVPVGAAALAVGWWALRRVRGPDR